MPFRLEVGDEGAAGNKEHRGPLGRGRAARRRLGRPRVPLRRRLLRLHQHDAPAVQRALLVPQAAAEDAAHHAHDERPAQGRKDGLQSVSRWYTRP